MKLNIFLLFGFLFILSFCGPSKDLIQTSPELPESPDRLYQFVLERNVPYNSLTINSIKIDFSTPDNNSRLYGSLKMIKDSAILISLRTALGIEVSRLLYTQDSVTMLDRQNKRAYFTDYNGLKEIAPIDFNFQMLQAIFSANIPGHYQITNMPEPQFVRDSVKNEVYLGTFNAPSTKAYLNFYGWVYKSFGRPSYIVFYKDEQNQKFTVKYTDYQKEASYTLPKEVEVYFDQYNQPHNLNLTLSDFTFNEYTNIDIDVPSSYKIIHL